MDTYQLVTWEGPAHNIGPCWQNIKELLPNHTDFQKLAITLWWCGRLPGQPSRNLILKRALAKKVR